MAEELVFRILAASLIVLFSLGVATFCIRRSPVWILVGQAVSWKALALASAVFAAHFPEKTAVLSVYFFVALFLLLTLTAIGSTILIREKRTESP